MSTVNDNGFSPPAGSPVRELTQDELVKLPMQALLVRLGRMTLDQLADALRENVATGVPVEQIAVQRGWVDAAEVEHLRSSKRALGAPVDEAPIAPPAPAPAPAPVSPAAQVPAPQPAQAHVPVPTPDPAAAAAVAAAMQAPAPEGDPGGTIGDDETAAVFVALTGGQRVRVSSFTSMDDCRKRADQVMDLFNRPEPGVWPRFGNRLVKPDAVTAIEISRRRDD
jgi:hypothetical protein